MRGPDDAAYAAIGAELSERYADCVTPVEVAAAVAQARAELEPKSSHPEFLAILVSRYATELLRAAASNRGTRLHPVPTVLFMCEHGAARSQMAAAIAHELGGDHVHVRAAGHRSAIQVDPLAAQVLAERGIDLHQLVGPGPLADVVHAPDVLIVMGTDADGVLARARFDWDVPDPHGEELGHYRVVRDDVERRVRGLLSDLAVPVAEPAPAHIPATVG